MTQLHLPVEGTTRCGYCNRRLVAQPEGDWKCGRCGPLLATLGHGLPYPALVAAWRQFARDAAAHAVADP